MENGQFEPFDLTVYLGPDAIPWISASSRVGAAHGIPRKSSSLPALPELLGMVHDYTDDIHFAELQADPEVSRILGDLVFGDPAVAQLFQRTRGVAADHRRQVLFRILASGHLAVLPWELLPDRSASWHDRWPYLALAPDTHLIRQARGRSYAMRTELLEAPLNLLLVLSSPIPNSEAEDWLSFDIFEVKRNLLSELETLERNGLLHVEVEDRPTPDNLRRLIGAQRRGFHLFHYVGHAYAEGLILEDRAGYRETMPAAKLAELLRLCPDLRLAVFAGCETARAPIDPATVDPRTTVGWRDLLSLADYCVQEACPAVIGMQAVLPFSTERIFTRFFYQALASGYTIAESLRLARGAIQSDKRVGGDLLDWSVPALFVGADEPGAIVPRTAPTPKPPPEPRAELNLGLRQPNSQFFGRDLALRQAIDVITGRTPERVLVVIGPSGIGKTSLIDRALEEIGNEASHALFVSFDRLAPDVEKLRKLFAAGNIDDLQKLNGLLAEGTLENAFEKLCRLTYELLSYSGVKTRDFVPGWKISDWWDRLVEDMVRRHFVLVIDGVGVLDHLQREFLEELLNHLFVDCVENRLRGGTKRSRTRLLKALSAQRCKLQDAEADKNTLLTLWKEIEFPEDRLKVIENLPDRYRLECAGMYLKSLEKLLGTGDSKEEPDKVVPETQVNAQSLTTLSTALCKLERIRSSLGTALGILADRRSPVRIIIITHSPPRDFFNLPDDMVFQMRLAPLTWTETWRWIRRNLPSLLRFGEDALSCLWGRFGVRLELWEELERMVLKESDPTVDLTKIAEKIIPTPLPRTSTSSLDQARQRGSRALRIAVAGPHLAGPNEIAEAITQLARQHGIGGRVVFDRTDAGALATLIDVPSPFLKEYEGLPKGTAAPLEAMISWLNDVISHNPDIILLDYMSAKILPRLLRKIRTNEQTLLRSIQQRALLIAAGGHKDVDILRGEKRGPVMVTTPSAFREVLSVGALDDEGKLQKFSEWNSRLNKPNLFMPDNLIGTPLAFALKPEIPSEGSSFAALHAVAAAALVWSLLPDLPPKKIRELLVDASEAIGGTKARKLTIEAAVKLARQRLVAKTLKEGPASLQTLSAITGLEGRIVSSILQQDGFAVRLSGGRLERFQLVSKN